MSKNKKKKKFVKWIVLAVVLVIIAVSVLQSATGVEEMLTVDVQEVKKGEVSSVLDTDGTIASENTKIYASPVTAAIAGVSVKAGQTVKKGDYLVTYDTASLEKTYTQAELQAKSTGATDADAIAKSDECAAESARQQTNINTLNGEIDILKKEISNIQSSLAQAGQDEMSSLSLQTSLEEKMGTLSAKQEELASAQAKKEAADAGIMSENAKASLTYNSQAADIGVGNAQEELNKAKAGVVAEFDGVVTSVDVVPGTTAAEGQVMMTVADTSLMKIDMQVSKYNLASLAVGQSVTITALEHTYEGKVSSISKMAIQQISENASSGGSSAMVAAEVHIDNPDGNLVIGMDAKLTVSLGNVQDALTVPVSAVNTDKDGDFVYLVENGKIKRQAVTTGLYGKENVEIKEGLEEKMHIVTVVDSTVKEGMKVTENLVED